MDNEESVDCVELADEDVIALEEGLITTDRPLLPPLLSPQILLLPLDVQDVMLRKELKQNPDCVDRMQALINVLWKQERYTSAISVLRRMVFRIQGDPRYRYQAGKFLLSLSAALDIRAGFNEKAPPEDFLNMHPCPLKGIHDLTKSLDALRRAIRGWPPGDVKNRERLMRGYILRIKALRRLHEVPLLERELQKLRAYRSRFGT